MKCPVCNVELRVAERQGVEIDHCPQCRGVWLDRGELDKIIDRSNDAPQHAPPRDEPSRYEGDDDRRRFGGGYGEPRRKKRGFLGDIFDLD